MNSLPSDIYHVLIGCLPSRTSVQLLISSKSLKTDFAESIKAWKCIYQQAGIVEDIPQNLSSAKDYQQALRTFFRVKDRIAAGRLPAPRLVAGTLPWLHKGAYPAISSLADLHIQDDVLVAWPQPVQGAATWGAGGASQNWKIINAVDPNSNPRPLGIVPKGMEIVFLGGGYFTLLPGLHGFITPIPLQFDIYKMGSPVTFKIPSEISELHPDFEIRYCTVLRNQRGYTNTFGVYLQYHHLSAPCRLRSPLLIFDQVFSPLNRRHLPLGGQIHFVLDPAG
jgi:hypothetical protein